MVFESVSNGGLIGFELTSHFNFATVTHYMPRYAPVLSIVESVLHRTEISASVEVSVPSRKRSDSTSRSSVLRQKR